DGGFQLLVQFVGAADEAHGGHAGPVFPERLDAGGDHFGIVGEAEIIVGAEIDHGPAADRHLALLRRSDDHFGLVETFGSNPVQLADQMLGEAVHHDGSSFLSEAFSNISDFKSMSMHNAFQAAGVAGSVKEHDQPAAGDGIRNIGNG